MLNSTYTRDPLVDNVANCFWFKPAVDKGTSNYVSRVFAALNLAEMARYVRKDFF